MAKFLMLGKYSQEAIKGIAAERTKKVSSIIEQAGGKIDLMYALLGNYDLVFVVDFSDVSSAVKASVTITKLTAISFTTYPAIAVEEFDRLVS